MTDFGPRNRLPDRRRVENFEFEHAGVLYSASIGFYETGRLGEIFLTAGKIGSDLAAATNELAVSASHALQRGATVEELRTSFPRQTDGTPEGAMGRLFDIIAERGEKA